MPRFGFTPALWVTWFCAAIISITLLNCCHGAILNHVSIEDIIDLDDNPHPATKYSLNKPPPDSTKTITITNSNHNDVTINIEDNNSNVQEEDSMQKGIGHVTILDPSSNDVIVDDEDLVASGSGSGSGDFVLDIDGGRNVDVDVLTGTTQGHGTKTNINVSGKGAKHMKGEGKHMENRVGSTHNDQIRFDKRNKKMDDIAFHDEAVLKDYVLQLRNDDKIASDDDIDNSDDDDNDDDDNENNNINISIVDSNTVKNVGKSSLKNSRSNSDNIKDSVSSVNNGQNDEDDNDDDESDDKGNETIDDDDKIEDNESDEYDIDNFLNDYEEDGDEEKEEKEETDEDSAYDLTNNMQSDDANNRDKKWSKWRRVGESIKVRTRNVCKTKGQKSSCDVVKVQVKSCTKKGGCGHAQDMTSDLTGSCDSVCHKRNESTSNPMTPIPSSPLPSPNPTPSTTTTTTTTTTTAPTPKGCQYSLYDKKRKKYVFVRWDLSQVLTQSKVKRWCKKDNDQYIIMSTPTDVCRNYLHNLCQASQKCKSSKPPRERGDFAEGCWRGLVLGDMLPVGLSNRQTIIYFICQRYSSDSEMGRVFGYKETHFGTLYDTKMRTPVLSLHKMLQVGDETWPESDYFIEHGLIEQKKAVMWLFSRHRKGIVSLSDLDRCYSDRPCELGKFQILPGDLSRDPANRAYTPTPLVWPEWMHPAPEARTATLTLTNMVPLHSSLHEEWHVAAKKVRTYAIEECGIPYVQDPNIGNLGQLSSHRTNKSALYLASGVIPSGDAARETNREVPIPSHLWVAGCCVRKLVRGGGRRHENDVLIDEEEDETSNTETKVSSFTFYIKNEPGNHVVHASVFRLEMILENFYKNKDTDPDVSLFPGQESACSDLRNDASSWFEKQ